MALFEPEETVGLYWHRLVGGASTYPRHGAAAIGLEEMRPQLGVLFRALGGDGAIRIAPGAVVSSQHRLSLLQKVGLGTEKLSLPLLDDTTLRLPPEIAIFPSRDDNAALYEWLAAWFAHARHSDPVSADPLQRDILRLRAALATTRATLASWPGLAGLYTRLTKALLDIRPHRHLPRQEARIEAAILAILGAPAAQVANPYLAAIESPLTDIRSFSAARNYRPFLPIPLFGEVQHLSFAARPDDAEDPQGKSISVDSLRRKASRRQTDQSDRDDPLLFHRFETLLSLSEMVNVNRRVDDDDEEGARQAAEDLPELTIGNNRKSAATRLKLDLDLAPQGAEGDPLEAALTYPEWDWKRQAHRRDHCRVLTAIADEDGSDWSPSEAMAQRVRRVQRQFEAIRSKRMIMQGQPDGEELDLSAVVRAVTDRRAGGPGTERVFTAARTIDRDLAVGVLVDLSLSTDAWIAGSRVLDIEKEALLTLSHGLTASMDEHAIFGFTSRRRSAVTVTQIKAYEEALGPRIERRIAALKPGQYTRMGAAIRHVAKGLEARPHRHRLMLVLTDGKPNDIDYYEGRYGIEDTRAAIREARHSGLSVFGITIDEHAQDYFPYIFGSGAYAIVPDAGRLPTALPAIYRQLVQ